MPELECVWKEMALFLYDRVCSLREINTKAVKMYKLLSHNEKSR